MTRPEHLTTATPPRNMTRPDLQWLLDDVVARIAGVTQVVVLSADGLVLTRSVDLDADAAEHMAAVASAFHSLARSAARQFAGGGVQQTVVEMDESLLLVTAAGTGACLAVLATAGADIAVVAYEIGLLVRRVGAALSTPARRPEPRPS